MFVSLCLQGWTMAHFTNIIPRIDDDAYDPTIASLVSQWKPPMGFSNPGHYRDTIDSLDHSHVIWRPYERRWHITPFQDICWYSHGSLPAETGWSVTCQSGFVGSTSMSRHGPGFLHTLSLLWEMMWPRPSRSLLYMSSAISRGVIWFRITSHGHMRWFVRVSHPIVNPLASISD